MRPRFGVMRGREFLMKDGYNFDLTKEDIASSGPRMQSRSSAGSSSSPSTKARSLGPPMCSLVIVMGFSSCSRPSRRARKGFGAQHLSWSGEAASLRAGGLGLICDGSAEGRVRRSSGAHRSPSSPPPGPLGPLRLPLEGLG
ncbi:hypothetical protein CNY89_09275 [Amaricoccus sp. HAR-UPW-R2A-40]|nr:hypothetical protein CNY89_09275 [Amaricoccus sp. HAR-UPW-R2A-40]